MIGIDQTVAHWSFADAFQKVRLVEHGCTRWLWCGMPVIPPELLNCCFYLYKSKDDAKAGRPFGGTGFVIAIPSGVDERRCHTFGVTNWHVAVRDGCSVIRMNKQGGGVAIIERDPAEWIFRPKWHDLAIIGLPDADEAVTALHRNMFLTKDDVIELGIWSGADVFMIGRFVDHDGRSTNEPSTRFGNMSVMPGVHKIKQPTNAELESFVLDVHARTGYSGSASFVYRTIGTDLRFSSLVTGPGTTFLKLSTGVKSPSAGS